MWLGCLLSVNVVCIICALSFLDSFASVSEHRVLALAKQTKKQVCVHGSGGRVWGVPINNLSLLACTIAGESRGVTKQK